jgi:glycerol-3-phosphate acyltransferase PlsY
MGVVAAATLGWVVGGRGLAVAGHVAPVTRRFRGGKGVATGFSLACATFPLAAGAAVVVVKLLARGPALAS